MAKKIPDNMKVSDFNPESQALVIQQLSIEQEKNRNLYLEAVDRAIRSLFALNSGGVVTVLAYMNSIRKDECISSLLIFSLIIFLIGLISALIVVAIDFFVLLARNNQFNKDVEKFIENKIFYIEIQRFKYFNLFFVSIFFGALSLLCIISGVGVGIAGYFNA